MNKKTMVMLMALTAAGLVAAQGKDDFVRQQAYAEMQRVSGQIDVLQSNLNDLAQRMRRLEGNGEARNLKAEVDALRAEIAALKRELQNQRGEIVRELSGRIAKLQTSASAPEPPRKPRKVYNGPCEEYKVAAGDSLYLIAQAFNTTVSQLKDMNNLKSDSVRVGQKLLVPKVKE